MVKVCTGSSVYSLQCVQFTVCTVYSEYSLLCTVYMVYIQNGYSLHCVHFFSVYSLQCVQFTICTVYCVSILQGVECTVCKVDLPDLPVGPCL